MEEAKKEDLRGENVLSTGPSSRSTQVRSHIYAGFLSGLTSSAVLQPLELIKTRVQQSQSNTISSILRDINGVSGLWRGTVPSVLRTSIGSAMYLASLNQVRQSMTSLTAVTKDNSSISTSSSLPKLSMQLNLASGALVRTAVGFLTMPITVIKVRYESSLYNYTSIFQATRSIYLNDGVRGFFYGFGVTAFRDAPYAGLYVLFYEKSKETLNMLVSIETDNKFKSSSMSINSFSAVMAAILATTITGPFDTIKTRVQLEPLVFKGFWRSAKLILQRDGPFAFFDGLSLRLTRKALSSGIAWCIYEELVKK